LIGHSNPELEDAPAHCLFRKVLRIVHRYLIRYPQHTRKCWGLVAHYFEGCS